MDEVSVVKLADAAFAWDFYPEDYVYDDQRERHLPLRWMAPESITGGYYDQRTDVVGRLNDEIRSDLIPICVCLGSGF